MGQDGVVGDTAVVGGELAGDIQQLVQVFIHTGQHRVVGRAHQKPVKFIGDFPQLLNTVPIGTGGLFCLPHILDGLVQGSDVLICAPLGGIEGRKGFQADAQLQQIHQSVCCGGNGEIQSPNQILHHNVFDIGAVTPAAVQHPHVLQDFQRLPNGDAAHIEPGRQIPFRGNALSAFQLPPGNHALDTLNDIFIITPPIAGGFR